LYHLDETRDAAKLAELAQKFPNRGLTRFVATVSGKEYVVYAVRPTRALYKRFRKQVSDDRVKSEALELLVCECVVHPEPALFQAVLDEAPGLSETFGEKLLEVSGLSVAADAKAF
jgi:hypothetical protein